MKIIRRISALIQKIKKESAKKSLAISVMQDESEMNKYTVRDGVDRVDDSYMNAKAKKL